MNRKARMNSEANNSSGRLKAILAFLFLMSLMISFVTVPFQSPDEFNHFKRAYLLSELTFIANENRPSGGDHQVTGAQIDTNLIKFMDIYSGVPFHYEKKWDPAQEVTAESLFFSDQKDWSDLPNTAVYFPLVYLPQAVAIKMGQLTHLSIHDTYKVAKVFSLMIAILLIYLSSYFSQVPIFALSILFFPMSLFQLSAASMDGVAFGLTFLVASLFSRGLNKSKSFLLTHLVLLILSFTILVSARIQLIPLYLIIILIAHIRKSLFLKTVGAISLIFTVLWNLWALENVKGLIVRSVTTIDVIKMYLKDPLALVDVFASTWLSVQHWASAAKMFVGVLGWLDVRFSDFIYFVLVAIWGVFAYKNKKTVKTYFEQLSNRNKAHKAHKAHKEYKGHKEYFEINLVYLGSLVSSVFLLYLILLLTWTNQPATIIEGIQGRYFVPLVILLFYFGSYGVRDKESDEVEELNSTMLFVLGGLSAVVSIYELMRRYYGV